MADKNVNTVTAATAVAAGDSLLVSKSNTTLQKIDYNLLAKAIIEQYTGSILAGSAQSLKSALDATYLLTGGISIPNDANIDTYTIPGKYGTHSSTIARTISGLPFEKGSSSNSAFNLIVENSAFNDPSARRQILQFYNDRYQWVRYGTTSSWTTSWERQPTRAEMDVLNSNLNGISFVKASINASASVVANISANTKVILYVIGAAGGRGEYIINRSGGGGIGYNAVLDSPNVPIVTNDSNGTITINNNTSAVVSISFIVLFGSLTI